MTSGSRRRWKRRNTRNASTPTSRRLRPRASSRAIEIFIRPPLGLAGPTQAFTLIAVEPGKFDIENSFIDEKKGTSLHVVARIKKPKACAGARRASAPAAEPVARGKFIDDVVELVKAAYSIELAPADLKPESKHQHGNRDERLQGREARPRPTKEVEVYVYTEPSRVHEVALIFEYPKAEKNYMDPKIGLCLESFAVGERARRDSSPAQLDWKSTAAAKWQRPPVRRRQSRRAPRRQPAAIPSHQPS